MNRREVAVALNRAADRPREANSYRIRSVRPSDAATLARQRAGMFRELGEIPDPEIVRHQRVFADWFRRELAQRRLWGFLAETPGGEPVAGGLLWLQPRPPSPRFPHRRIPYLLSVYTEPAYRRQGVGGRIVQELIGASQRLGYPRVELHATAAGRSIYRRLGFRATNQMRLQLPAGTGRGPVAPARRGQRRGTRKVPGLSSETC